MLKGSWVLRVSWLTSLRLPTCTLSVPIFFVLVTTRNLTVTVLHYANFTNFLQAIFKQFNFTVNHKSSGKMESVTMDVVAEENQEECLGIQPRSRKWKSTGINGGRGKQWR